MYVVTLLTDPVKPSLGPALCDSLRNAWGGRSVAWLSPDEAAEFTVSSMPENRWNIWSDLQEMSVDMVVQPEANRRKKMLLADMDSTMIAQECIDELAECAGVGEHVKDITARAMNGELNFETALKERVSLLRGLDQSVILQVLEQRITLTAGGKTLLATMKTYGAHSALVSGGFSDFTSDVAKRLGFDEHRANVLLAEDDKLTGEVASPILGQAAKIEALEQITDRLGISDSDVIAVGDGANDLGMLHRAGTGVALHAKPSVAQQCDVRINHGDLTALLYLQGYARSEFVEPGNP